MNLILFDTNETHLNLLPLTYTRPIAEQRIGILKISEKWAKRMQTEQVSFLTQPYLSKKYPARFSTQNLYIFGGLLPDEELLQQLDELTPETAIFIADHPVALLSALQFGTPEQLQEYAYSRANRETCAGAGMVNYTWDIFVHNRAQIITDFQLITQGRRSQRITDKYTMVYGEDNIFVEEGVQIRAAILNGEDGVIYLGKNSQIGEGSVIKGALALCEGATLNVGAKIRGDSTIGPYCRIGGEVSNSVLQGYSNKGHEGFMGNSVIGEWCNLGADTNTSNLKNNYSHVQVWNFKHEDYINSGRQFCGLVMGDHAKCSINTMFNTGTVVGTGANLFGADFPPKFVPPFAWGGAAGFSTFRLDKAFELAERMMERRNLQPSKEDIDILTHVFEHSKKYRTWEHS